MPKTRCTTLIAYQNNENSQTDQGNTPLMKALTRGSLEDANQCLRLGANVNVANLEGLTPLHLAIKHGLYKLVDNLILKNANVNAQDNLGNTPLHLAAKGITIPMYVTNKLLRANAQTHLRNKQGETALFTAVKYRNIKVASKLLEINRNICDIRDIKNNSPLEVAVHLGDLACVKALYEAGAAVTLKALYAVKNIPQENTQIAIVRVLAHLNDNVEVNMRTYIDCMETYKDNPPLLMGELMKIGITIDYLAQDPRDLLIYGCLYAPSQHQLYITQLALKLGADPAIKNYDGISLTQVMLQQPNKNPNIISLLIHHDSSIQAEFNKAAQFVDEVMGEGSQSGSFGDSIETLSHDESFIESLKMKL